MIDLSKDIHSLTDFKRRTQEFMKQMQETGHPVVLTVNGKAALVIQDVASYQQLIDAIEQSDAIAGIRRGLEQVREGRTRPVDEAMEALREKYGFPADV